jgi:glyceraldehyde 3-phosphate dehydrogenase
METMKVGYETSLNDYIKNKKNAVELINSIGHLMFDKGVELVFFRNHMVDISISELLNLFEYAKNVVNKPIEISIVNDIVKELKEMDLAPSKIDIGKLSHEYLDETGAKSTISSFLVSKLSNFIGQENHTFSPQDVILYGFGRIGRIAARELIRQAGKGQQLRLRAIVLRKVDDFQIEKRAALLRNDSVHGSFKGTIIEDFENKCLIINGQKVQLIEAGNPEDVDYTKYGINNALVIDNTGVFKDREALGRHLKSKGTAKVLLTAPGTGVPNIVYGINHQELDIENENIYSAASCTTNAISPVLKVIEDKFGVESGHIETIHAYTNDQNLLDNFHKKPRRGRSAAINMVITSTGAGKAVTKVIPSLTGKLTSNAVRVPTPNGSLAIIKLSLINSSSVEEINDTIRNAAIKGDLINQIKYEINQELVSNDIIGNTCASVFDSNATLTSSDGKNCVLYSWYDNEFGYTKQVIRIAKYITKVRRLIYY